KYSIAVSIVTGIKTRALPICKRVPRELGVVVGVKVDDAGRQDQARPIDPVRGGAEVVSDGGDPAVLDREAPLARRGAQAIDDACVGDHQVVHVTSSLEGSSGATSRANRRG